MKRNLILITAVAVALGSAGARAAQDADECAQDALQLKMQIEQSNLSDADRANLESSLNEAQSSDLARCEQIVARVKREVGAGADAATTDDYGEAASRESSTAAGAAAGTTEASPSSTTGLPAGSDEPATTDRATGLSGGDSASTDSASGTTGATSGSSGSATTPQGDDSAYEPGHATADETLPEKPGADENSAEPADTTMKEEGYASPESTEAAQDASDDMSSTGGEETQNPTTGAPDTQSATTNPGATTPAGAATDPNASATTDPNASATTNPGAESTTMHPIEEEKPNPSADRIAAMTTDELVNKPVQDAKGEELGEINAIVVDRNATPHAYTVVQYGGVLGIGEKQVLVDLDKLELTADGGIRVPATDEDAFSAYPRYDEKLYQKYQGNLGDVLKRGG